MKFFWVIFVYRDLSEPLYYKLQYDIDTEGWIIVTIYSLLSTLQVGMVSLES